MPLLALGYAAGLWLLFARTPALMRTLAPVGRMALSNYLMHSVVGVIVFYGLGFGLFGKLSLTSAVVVALLLFGVQVVFSRLVAGTRQIRTGRVALAHVHLWAAVRSLPRVTVGSRHSGPHSDPGLTSV